MDRSDVAPIRYGDNIDAVSKETASKIVKQFNYQHDKSNPSR